MQNGQINLNPLYNSKLNKFFGEIEIKDKQNVSQIQKILPILYKISMKIFFLNFSILSKKYNINSLDLSGGCAMNSLANGKIKEKTNFKYHIKPTI